MGCELLNPWVSLELNMLPPAFSKVTPGNVAAHKNTHKVAAMF